MPAYDIRTLQLRILDILVQVDRVCCSHQLTYYLAAGTLLGAVRHKGFIPWDDDIDIAMPRADYDRFVQHAHEWLPEPLEFLCAERYPDYPGSFGKVVNSNTTLIERQHHAYVGGIYIDVFPIDGMTGCKFMQRLHFVKYKLCDKLIYLICRDPYKHGHGIQSWFPLLCRRCFSLTGVMKHLQALQRKYSKPQAKWVVDHDFGMRGIMPPEVYGTPQPITFEGVTLQGVAQPDRYLTALYGDYMTIPPGPKQKQHNFYFLDYDLPYRAYEDKRAFTKIHFQKK